LPVDGIAGPETKEALVRERGGKPASSQQAADRTADTQGNNKPIEPVGMEPVPSNTTKSTEPEPMTPASEFDFEWENFDIEEQETSVEKRCREQWLKWLATLPAPVQEASRQVKNLDDQDPLMLRAIQHGIRDPDYLARLAFYSLGRFGYCPPKGSGLESWRQYRLRAKALLKVPVPTAPDIGPRSCVGRGENKRDAARPDAPALDITGRYYFWQDRKPFATVLINQAGRRITMRATLLLGAGDRQPSSNQLYPDRPYKEYEGDLQADGTFRFFNRDKLTEQGTIFRKDNRLLFRMDRTSSGPMPGASGIALVRMENRPTLLAPPLDLVSSVKQGPLLGKVLKRHELYPLAPGQIRQIREVVKKSLMDARIGPFFQTSDHKKKYHLWSLLVQQLAKLAKEFHPSDLPLVRLYAREELTFNKLTSNRNVRRSHLDWIQMMTDFVRSEIQPGTYDYADYYKTLADYLGIRLLGQRYQEKPPHTYQVTIQLSGGALYVGMYWGHIRIEKTSEPKWPEPKTFPLDLSGVVASIGPDVKFGGNFTGIAQSYLPWTPNDIPGSVRMFRAAADAGMGLASAQAGFMHILGDGALNPLDVFFQDANLGAPDPAKVGEEGIKEKIEEKIDKFKIKKKAKVTPKGLIKPDLTVSALFGSIGGSFWMVQKLPVIDASTPVAVQKVDVDATGRQRIHFCFASAVLTGAGRDSLRQLCADYLPLFLNPQTQLVVVGHADSVGTAGYNLALSRNRAENTVQAIRDILGSKFRVKHLAIPVSELVARLGGRNEQPDPRFRRVDVFLNGHLVLTLGGPTAP
jgi:outer membrane protein OmpA-like peptidoglycan-associated protein